MPGRLTPGMRPAGGPLRPVSSGGRLSTLPGAPIAESVLVAWASRARRLARILASDACGACGHGWRRRSLPGTQNDPGGRERRGVADVPGVELGYRPRSASQACCRSLLAERIRA